MVELDLHLTRRQLLIRHNAFSAVVEQRHTFVVSRNDATAHITGDDEATGVATPMARFGQRSVDAWRGDLERVGAVPGDVGAVECVGHHARDASDGVHVCSAVAVDDDADDTAATGNAHRDVLEVEACGRDDGYKRGTDALSGDGCHHAPPAL